MNFALIGVAGYVAPRHLKAIRDTGNTLVAVTDPFDAVGVLDQYFDDVDYFREFERFDRHIEKLRHKQSEKKIDYVSICSPNFLHDAHIRFALRVGADAICEKPLVLNPWNLDALEGLEKETGRRVYTVLQLRTHPEIMALKEKVDAEKKDGKHEIDLTYITGRGNWYFYSWKGEIQKAGGLATNIGIHFFDLLLWAFGKLKHAEVHVAEENKTAGFFEMEKARVRWYLSVDKKDLQKVDVKKDQTTFRSILIDGKKVEFSKGFTELHSEVYRKTLAGQGFTIADARPSIELAYRVRHSKPVGVNKERAHRMLG